MSKPESLNELHRLGEFVNDQHDGRKDQPVTGGDLYNLAVQLDSNFASLRSESVNLRIEMAAEFKAVRAEMAEGFAKSRYEMSRIPIKTAAWVATTMIGLIGVGSALVAAVITVI
ncbi:MAG: hypothetical protein ACYC06_11530 [Ilumatobacteraceae bacterium]